MSKKVLKIILIVTFVILGIGICVFCFWNSRQKHETDLYSVAISKEWSVEEPYEDCKNFVMDDNRVAGIEVFRDCSYCESAESIGTNIFGEHGFVKTMEETVVNDWTRYKMIVDYELTAAEEMQGTTKVPSQLHYIYTNKKDIFIDVYVNEQLLSENEIQKFINSFEVK